jgi:two-component system KDP operon response regulator KdpE
MMSQDPLPRPSERSPSILIVDDDEYVHGALEAALRGMHVHLLTANTAAEGESLAMGHEPELAIIDVGLPDRDGYQLTASLRRRGLSGTRILILTGYAPDEEAARAAGANALVAKPFRLHQFLDLVRQQLEPDARTETEPRIPVHSSPVA